MEDQALTLLLEERYDEALNLYLHLIIEYAKNNKSEESFTIAHDIVRLFNHWKRKHSASEKM